MVPQGVRSYIDACCSDRRISIVPMSPVRQALKKGESGRTTLHIFKAKGHPEVAYSSCRSYCRWRNHSGSRIVRSRTARFVLVSVRCLYDDVCSNVILRGIKRNDTLVRVVVSIGVCDAICRVSASRRALTSLMACSALATLVAMHWVCRA